MTDLISSGLEHTSFLKTRLYYFPLFDKSWVIHQSQFTGNLALFVWLPWHPTACGTAFKTNTVLPKQLSTSALQRALAAAAAAAAAAAVLPPRHRPNTHLLLRFGHLECLFDLRNYNGASTAEEHVQSRKRSHMLVFPSSICTLGPSVPFKRSIYSRHLLIL